VFASCFLDLSQGTVCREIGLAGFQLPPLPLLDVAPLSTAAVGTDFTASFKDLTSLLLWKSSNFCLACHFCCVLSCMYANYYFFFLGFSFGLLISKFDAGTKLHPALLNVSELLHSKVNVNNELWIVQLTTGPHIMFA
jgi:hypothetical protein